MSRDDLTQLTIADFVAAAASKAPAPGGGAVAAVVGSLATALGEMALAFSRDRKSNAAHAERLAATAVMLEKARAMFLQLAHEDAEAFALYEQAARRKDGDPGKARAAEVALAVCIEVPRETAKLALRVLDELVAMLETTGRWLISDLAAGAVLAESVTRLADLNVRINATQLADAEEARELLAASEADCRRAADLGGRLLRAAHDAIAKQ